MPETRHSSVYGSSSLSWPGLSLSWVFKVQGLNPESLLGDILGTPGKDFLPHPAGASERGIFDGHWKRFPPEQIPLRPR